MDNRTGGLSDKVEISFPELSLPKGGGAVRGIGESFQPNPFSGSVNISFPVHTSPCRNFEPQLHLNYHSGSGNSVYGLGFDIDLPNISRKTEKGIPRYTDHDIFIWSEADDLVPRMQTGEDGAERVDERQVTEDGSVWTVRSYLPRVEANFAQIERWSSDRNCYWKVVSKDNVTSIFGQTDRARIVDPHNPDRIFKWLIESSYDAKGNRIEYHYKEENNENLIPRLSELNRDHTANKYIERIKYGCYTDAAGHEQWGFEVVFDYGEYDISDEALSKPGANPYVPVRSWPVRPDPYSTYRSGFEIRTLRRCRNILMFHRFEEELGANPCLVRATMFTYEESSPHSRLISLQNKGFRRKQDTSYAFKAMPPELFTYTEFQPAEFNFKPLIMEGGTTLVPTLSAMHAVDLHGDGLPGYLYTDGKATLYWRSSGDGSFHPPQIPYRFPVDRNLDQAHYSFMSLSGNGKKQLVYASPQRAGFYEAQSLDDWSEYREFESFPLDFLNARAEFVDMSGGGLADIAIYEGNALKIYPSLRDKGFGAPTRAFLDDVGAGQFPVPNQADAHELVGYADLFGDGLSHRFRIRSGSVECWPNVGYGHFAPRVRLDNAPDYGDRFDASRLFVTDVDGDGLSDLVYVHADRFDLYLNVSGNSFTEPITIPLPDTFTPIDHITFSDINGNGTNCLVFSKLGASVRHYYYDFAAGTKPYLLVKLDNNLGAETHIGYASSVQFYLADERAGTPWRTKLPFPVQVVERIESIDRISGSKTVTTFKYHDGYYDPVEREFNGFGFVEQWDAEQYDEHADTERIAAEFKLERYERELHVPPVYTRRWFHTGAYLESGILSRQYEQEYYHGDPDAYRMPDSTFDPDLDLQDTETVRQAYRALRGHLLREEIYGLDGLPELSANPYRVTESNYDVRLIQPRGSAPYAVFHVDDREEIDYEYDRNPKDPRVHHHFVLQTDEYGNELQKCDVYYPRRVQTGEDVRQYPEQMELKLTVQCTEFVNRTEKFRLLGIPVDIRLWELGGTSLDGKPYFSFVSLYGKVQSALQSPIPYHEPFTPGAAQARLQAWTRNYFWNEAQDAPLPLGELTALALPHHAEEAVFPDALYRQLFQGKATEAELEQDGGYALMDGYWWNRGEVQYYYGEADRLFYLPHIIENSFADASSDLRTRTVVEYDAYALAPVRTTQYLTEEISNEIRAEIDYIALQPKQIVDINGNVSQVLFDPLGYVFVTSIYGTTQGQRQGDMDLSEYREIRASGIEDVLASPDTYIQGASSYFYYDLEGWRTSAQPCGFVNLIRNAYVSDDQSGAEPVLQMHVDYMDGFGRTAESKSKVDPGKAVMVDETGTPVVLGNRPLTAEADERWIVSGRTVYNNKGNPVKQYLPYFSSTYRYEQQQSMDTVLPPPTVTTYDPLGRVVRVDTPKGFFSKTEYTPWEERDFDENDTVADSVYYAEFMQNYPPNPTQRQKDEKDALDKAAVCYNTPSVQVMNTIGQPFLEIACNLGAVGPDLFRALVDGTVVTAEQLWQQLQDKGYLRMKDTALGRQAWITEKFRPYERGFQLELDEPYRQFAAGATVILKQSELITYHELDISGNRLRSVDPRLYYGNCQNGTDEFNIRYVYGMSGNVLYTGSSDAGERWTLYNIYDNPIHVWDGRGLHTANRYDRFKRPVQVHVEGDDGEGLSLNQIVEKFVYGEYYEGAAADAQDLNLRGQIYQLYDQAGLLEFALYNIQSKPLVTERRLRVGYDREVNWNDGSGEKLEDEKFTTTFDYDATGKIISEQTPDGSRVTPEYNLIGSISQINVRFADGTEQPYITATAYNEFGQYTFIQYGNGMTSTYTYEDTTKRLLLATTERGGGTEPAPDDELQHIAYCYDPVGNITRTRDSTYKTVFCNQQVVEPLSDYTYNPIYRLIQANGRQHPGITASADPYGFKQSMFAYFCPPHPNDGDKLENYKETYAYDDSGNLTGLKHSSDSISWSRAYDVDSASNRLKRYSSGNGTMTAHEAKYDANGNMSDLENVRRLDWNYRNLPAKADIVERADAPSDSGYYVYDGNGQRIRQVSVRMISDGVTEIRDKIYLGKLEVKRIRRITGTSATTVLERQSLFVSDDQHCVAISNLWLTDTMGMETDEVNVRKDRYQLNNLQGSSCLEVDREAKRISYEEYFPYGGTSIIAGNNEKEVKIKDFRYCGKERDDNTGLYYYGARYYPPWLGRWLSPDPAGTVDGLNLYAFVVGNPVTYFDAGGLGISKQSKKIYKKSKINKNKAKQKYGLARKEYETFKSGGRLNRRKTVESLRGGRSLRLTSKRVEAISKELHKQLDRAKVDLDQFLAPPSSGTPLPKKVINPVGVQGSGFSGKTTYIEQQHVVSQSSLNVDGRDSTNETMAKAYGFGVKNLPASTYSGRDDSGSGGLGEAWCHLIAHCLGGAETSDNLVAGSQGSNLVQLGIERAIKSFVENTSQKLLIRVGADVRLLSNGKITHIADQFYYQIWDLNGKRIYHTSFTANILRADTLQKQKETDATKALYKHFGLALPKKLVA